MYRNGIFYGYFERYLPNFDYLLIVTATDVDPLDSLVLHW